MFGIFGKLKIKSKKIDLKVEENIQIIKNSVFFDGVWYLENNEDVAKAGIVPEAHYYKIGWKEGRDPSEYFHNKIYLKYNNDVKRAKQCPLYHFESFGKFEGRKFTDDSEIEKMVKFTEEEYEVFKEKKEKSLCEKIEKCNKIKVEKNRIVFKTFQSEYTCNPKYICNEILKHNKNWDLIWITSKMNDIEKRFPENVKVLRDGSKEAFQAVHSAKIIVDNGVYMFSDLRMKKNEQVSIETWHGSLGFKKLLNENMTKERIEKAQTLYGKVNDYVLTNSDFEEDVFKTSYWPEEQFKKYGHPRNDILISGSEEETNKIKKKVFEFLGIDEDKKVLLYAPTFRETEKDNRGEFENQDVYDFKFEMMKDALKNKFGGDWCIIIRHHFINQGASSYNEEYINGALYPDIQELMVAADIAVTDYSSWILDFMFTRKPAFLFAVDYDKYSNDRGFCYPLNTSPFDIATSNEEMVKCITDFDNEVYLEKISGFMKEKGCIEDGNASKRTFELIEEIIES